MSEPTTQAAPAAVTPKPPKPWKPPRVEIGMTVYWFPDGACRQPHAAVVTGLGMDGVLNLNVFLPNSYNLALRDGVRHCADPRLRPDDVVENGVWDHAPWYKQLLQLVD